MQEVNLSFLLYFIAPQSPAEVKQKLEQVFGFSMHVEEADAPLDERINSFEGDVFGLNVMLRLAYVWPEGNVYWLCGGVNKRLHASDGELLSISSHVARLLRSGGFASVMSREAFVTFCDDKGR